MLGMRVVTHRNAIRRVVSGSALNAIHGSYGVIDVIFGNTCNTHSISNSNSGPYYESRRFLASKSDESDISIVAQKLDDDNKSNGDEPTSVFYEGPFGGVALKLKRVSLTTCIIGLIGMPGTILIKHGGDGIPIGGQLAIAGTAAAAAIGSTLLLSYFFNPYVHKMEYIDPGTGDTVSPAPSNVNDISCLHIRATTRTLLATQLETVFDPSTIVPAQNSRPFCNFTANGIPMYCHPQLLHDPRLLKVFEKSSSRSHM